MEAGLIVPFIVSHAVAVVFVIAAWRWPQVTRYVAGAGFAFAGLFNLWWAWHHPEIYARAYGPHAIALYREFIYGAFARHTAAFVTAIAIGQITAGALTFAPLPWRYGGFAGAMIFLLAITPLGIGAAAPSTLVFAAGFVILAKR